MYKTWTSKKMVKKLGICLLSALLVMSSIVVCPIQEAFAGTTTNYLAFTSDVHDKTDDLESWLQKLPQTPEYVVFGGDYSYSGRTTPQQCADLVSSVFPGVSSVLAKGNHDSSTGTDEGLEVENDDYAIYAVNSTGSGGSVDGTYTQSDLDNLETALESIDPDIPVFIISHHPIHYYGSRTTGNASAMIDLLNGYSNVIFLWGHNHSVSDENYGVVKFAGDELQYTSSSSDKKEIDFTYANAGCIYTDRNGAYGLFVEISNNDSDTNIKFMYKDLNGNTTSTYTLGNEGDTPTDPDKPVVTTYELADSIESGSKYVIVAGGTADVALTAAKYEDGDVDYLAGKAVTVSGTALIATEITSDMIWTLTRDGDGFDIVNGNNYLTRPSGGGKAGLFLSSTEEDGSYTDWIHDQADRNLYTHSGSGSDYNIYQAAGSSPYYFSNGKDTVGNLYLYKLTVTEIDCYLVKYNGNGSTGGSVPADSKYYANGDKVTVLGNTGGLTLPGYTFAGWNTAANGSGTAYTAGSILEVNTSDVTFYAQWSKDGSGGSSKNRSSSSSNDKKITTPFEDIDDHWAYENIVWTWYRGFMNGISDSVFDPDGRVTRAMFVTVMYRFSGAAESGITARFHDVSEDEWYTDAVGWASENGIVTGYPDGNFGVNDFITREQMSAILYRYMLKFEDDTIDVTLSVLHYNDSDQIAEWARDSVKFAYLTGLMRGKNGFYFDPKGRATRAETAAIINRMGEL